MPEVAEQLPFALAEKLMDIVLPGVVLVTVAVLVNVRPPHCWSKSLKDMLRLLPMSVPETALEPDRPNVSVKASLPVTSVPDCTSVRVKDVVWPVPSSPWMTVPASVAVQTPETSSCSGPAVVGIGGVAATPDERGRKVGGGKGAHEPHRIPPVNFPGPVGFHWRPASRRMSCNIRQGGGRIQ